MKAKRKKTGGKGMKATFKKLTGSMVGVIILIVIIVVIIWLISLIFREWLLHDVYSTYTNVYKTLGIGIAPFNEVMDFWKTDGSGLGLEVKYDGSPLMVFHDIDVLFKIKKHYENKVAP